MIQLMGLLLAVALFAQGCSPMKMSKFENSKIKFVPEEYFDGKVVGHGTFLSRFGKNKAFRLDLEGKVQNGILVIEETATYEDGEVHHTSYTFEKLSPHKYRISSPSFVEAVYGELYGNALNWSYLYKYKAKDGEKIIRFNDWMILHDDGVLIDRAFGSKWGIGIGEIILSMKRVEGDE